MEFARKRMVVRARDRVRLLVVEDDDFHTSLVADVLNATPAFLPRITRTRTLAETLECLSREDHDVVVLDLDLPDSHGLDTLRSVVAARRDLPIVVLTGVDEPQIAAAALRAGASEYLVKGRLVGDLLWRVLGSAIDRKPADSTLRALAVDVERRSVEHNRELELAHDELEAFVHSAAHDLRSPLRSIAGLLTLFEDEHGGQLDGDATDLLSRVQRNVGRMDALLTSLVTYADIAEASATREEVDLALLARVEFNALTNADPTRQVELVVPERLPVDGDVSLLRLALGHLLSNAWKFTGTRAPARIELGCDEREDGPPVYYIRDNGVGFDERHAQRLFQPFERLHSKRELLGTGLGLATVKLVVGRHLGWLRAESPPHGGATFYFTLQPDRQPARARQCRAGSARGLEERGPSTPGAGVENAPGRAVRPADAGHAVEIAAR